MSKKGLNYEDRRHKFKNGIFSGSLIFFTSTIGIGPLINQYFVGKSGLLWGICITFLICYLVMYTLDQMLLLTKQIEQDLEIKITNFDEFAGHVFGKTVRVISKLFIMAYNEAVLLVNTINLCKFLLGQQPQTLSPFIL